MRLERKQVIDASKQDIEGRKQDFAPSKQDIEGRKRDIDTIKARSMRLGLCRISIVRISLMYLSHFNYFATFILVFSALLF